MSDPKKFPNLPPDDFSKTTPNIPRPDDVGSSDWEKTNYNAKFAPQPPADDWGKTIANIPPIKDEPDFNRTFMPSQKSPDWGVTNANPKTPDDDFGGGRNQGQGGFDATSPFIQLPDAERAKYQNLPPTPTQAAEQKKEEDKKKGGIPTWFWAAAALLSVFFIAIIAIIVVYIIAARANGFEIVIQNPPPQPEVWIDNQAKWGVTEGDGTVRLQGLKAGTRLIEIRKPGYNCPTQQVIGENGSSITIASGCSQTSANVTTQKNNGTTPGGADCAIEPKLGEFAKAERCADAALDALKPAPNYTAEELTNALNIFIINFDKDKFNIPSERMRFLERAAGFIKNLPETTVLEIGGHTDDRNTDEYNLELSKNRATAVKNALVKFGVRPNALETKGYGEKSPKVTNDTEENRFFNRRIQYSVVRR